MSQYQLYVEQLTTPAVIVHGGAGAYLTTTTPELRQQRGTRLLDIARLGLAGMQDHSVLEGVLDAIGAMELDPRFNAGFGSKLQRDGKARVSAALMNGTDTRLSAVYNVRDLLHPSQLVAELQKRGDRNLDGKGAQLLMRELGVAPRDLRTRQTIERWRDLVSTGDTADAEGAIGDAGFEGLQKARAANIEVPGDLEGLRPSTNEYPIPQRQRPVYKPGEISPLSQNDNDDDRFGTVGIVVAGYDQIWACTSTGGRGHESVGRISDTPTPAGNYACPQVAISATGFGEQILDLNICGRIATRVIDGMTLEEALRRTFDEVVAHKGLLGVIAVTDTGMAGYAYSTEACGIAWVDGFGNTHIDPHGRP